MGQLTTITNGWYGVRGGQNVSTLLINFNTVYAMRSAYSDISVLERDFQKWHAPAAGVFAKATRPLFERFIRGGAGSHTQDPSGQY